MGESTGAARTYREELHVLVTGFGPWSINAVNPAYLIARAIQERFDLPDGPVIHVHTLPDPVRVSYMDVRRQIPPLLFPPVSNGPPPTFDLVLFIGMAAGRSYYAVETRAFRDGYAGPDVDGKVLEGAEKDVWKQLYKSPEVLRPRWEPEDVWRRWKTRAGDVDVRTSTDAGRFLCEFIYYTGLVEYWRQGRAENAQVAFLHVPKEHDSQSVEKGATVAGSLIMAIVESETAKGNLLASRVAS